MSEVEIGKNGVWIPLALADRLFACYYGSGPKHPSAPKEELSLHKPEGGAVPPPPPREEEEMRWVPPIPRGINARKMGEAKKE